MVRVLTVAVLQIVISFNCTYSGRCSTRHRLFKRLRNIKGYRCLGLLRFSVFQVSNSVDFGLSQFENISRFLC